jgi:colanic acid/amylovoran biosynthesis glycosyltransferase
MRLAITCDNPNSYSETFIRSQFETLPSVMAIYGGPVAAETLPGGPIHPFKSARGLIDTAYHCLLKGRRLDGPQSAELARRLRKLKIDAVLANFGTSAVALAPVCARLQIPLIAHFHGYDAHQANLLANLGPAYRDLGRTAAVVIAVSTAMRSSLIQLGIPEHKIHLIRYGADPSKFQQRIAVPRDPVFFGVGRFVDKKAPYLTLLAFKAVHDRFNHAQLILAGDGPLEEVVRNLAKTLQLEDAVQFPGVLIPGQVARQMSQATAFVQHSLSPRFGPSKGDCEGTPVAVLESMMAGLPVIATRHTGITEVVLHGQTGLLCDERDVDTMAAHMIQLIEQPHFGQQLGEQARLHAMTHFTSAHYTSALLTAIQSACPVTR